MPKKTSELANMIGETQNSPQVKTGHVTETDFSFSAAPIIVLREMLQRAGGLTTLENVTVMQGPIDEAALGSLISLLSKNPNVKTFTFSGTQLRASHMNKLLQALSNHPALEAIYLNDCFITKDSQDDLALLICKAPKLTILDLSHHGLATDDSAKIEGEILKSRLLKVSGLNLTEQSKMHLQVNMLLAQLESMIDEWQKDSDLIACLIEVRKEIFYKMLQQIPNDFIYASRRNHILTGFFRLLANNFQQLNDIDNAEKYFDRCLEIQDEALQCDIHISLAELFYNYASKLQHELETKHDEDESELNNVNGFLLKSTDHLTLAERVAANPQQKATVTDLKKYIDTYSGEQLIARGEALLTRADAQGQFSFRRHYKKL